MKANSRAVALAITAGLVRTKRSAKPSMSPFIAVACLNCGHCARLSDDDLARHRVAKDVPLVTLTRRLTCSECGSRAVQAFRQDDSPSIVPE